MDFPSVHELEPIPSAELEKVGWTGLHDRLKRSPAGALLITGQHRPEGVLLTPDEYTRLIRLAGHRIRKDGEILEEIRREFDQHLAALTEPGAEKRLRDAINEPLFTDGRFLTGDSD
ncbi:hypothetical protein [Marinimicrobium sp. C2-29]|uniref:hypothetical protein n=1 Tax=Marinimicrobium sp. C2-29 TaxID=3139825 RepID=UPI0031386942